MDTKVILIALVALGIGLGGGYTYGAASPAPTHEMSGMQGSMESMMSGLEGKSGDDFDKAFLSEMIEHHEGAVAMAEAAKVHAQHTEIQEMADAIISAQTTEIAQMKEWQKSWYGE